jgi:tetratricopeptide (TPR) repeat protein
VLRGRINCVFTASPKIFISSTWRDLQPERKAVEAVVHRLRDTEFVGMEYFGSRPETTLRASLGEVDRSHVYVGIFGARYGSGITEQEYRRARGLDLPCLIYFKEDSTIPPDMRETDTEKLARLAALKEELAHAHTVSTFNSPPDLAALVAADLHNWLFDKCLTPALEQAARGEVSHEEMQSLLAGIKNKNALGQDLLARLQVAGYNVAVGGDVIGGDVIGRDHVTNIYNASSPVINALHQLPTPPRDFTGRTIELAELMAAVERGGATISGLQGLGGVGKTTLALKLAEQLTARYPDAQFYLDLKGASKSPLPTADAMAHVIRAYHPTAKLPESEAELSALYRSVLHNQRALLLMDNAANRQQVEPLIPPATCVMLVTSRQHFHLPGLFTKNLDTLPAEDARALLLKIAPRISEHAGTLAKLCGYLPLALRLAASAMAERIDLRPQDYVQRLSDAQQRLKLIDASLSLSYELLSTEMQRLWCLLSVFPNTFDVPAVAAVWEIQEDAAQDTLSELVKYSMVEWSEATARYHLHDLARIFADTHLSEAERGAGQKKHAIHYSRALFGAEERYLQGGEAIKRALALFDLEWTNIQTGQSWATKHSSEDNATAKLCIAYPDCGAYLLHLRQQPRERIDWLESALAASRRIKDRAAEGRLLGNLGVACEDLGETRRAIELHEQDLTIAREIGDQRGEASALGNLGIAYAVLGKTRRAIEFHEQDLAIRREIGDQRGEGNALGNLGNAYKNLGETRRAIEFYEQWLVIVREIGDRRGEGNGLWNKSLVLDEIGERAQAIAHAEAALKIREEIEDPNAAKVRKALARWRGEGE